MTSAHVAPCGGGGGAWLLDSPVLLRWAWLANNDTHVSSPTASTAGGRERHLQGVLALAVGQNTPTWLPGGLGWIPEVRVP